MPVPLRESNEFRLRIEDLETGITEKTRLVVLNSPQNPTGGVLTASDLEAIAELALRHDFLILSDEIYSDISYGQRPGSMLHFPAIRDRLRCATRGALERARRRRRRSWHRAGRRLGQEPTADCHREGRVHAVGL